MRERIVCFINDAYLPVAENWLAAITRLHLEDRVLIVALDDSTAGAFGERAEVLHRPAPVAGLEDMWVHRTQVLSEILASGQDIIHSDADAVWLEDPLPELFDRGEDAVFSQGTVWPLESLGRRGFVLCCGLFGLRSNSRSRRFMTDVLERVRVLKDDQWAVNQVVDELAAEWPVADPYWLEFQGRKFVSSPQKMTAATGSLKLSVLPHHRFPRLVGGLRGVAVAHPFSGKTAAATEEALRAKSLWILREPTNSGSAARAW